MAAECQMLQKYTIARLNAHKVMKKYSALIILNTFAV